MALWCSAPQGPLEHALPCASGWPSGPVPLAYFTPKDGAIVAPDSTSVSRQGADSLDGPAGCCHTSAEHDPSTGETPMPELTHSLHRPPEPRGARPPSSTPPSRPDPRHPRPALDLAQPTRRAAERERHGRRTPAVDARVSIRGTIECVVSDDLDPPSAPSKKPHTRPRSV